MHEHVPSMPTCAMYTDQAQFISAQRMGQESTQEGGQADVVRSHESPQSEHFVQQQVEDSTWHCALQTAPGVRTCVCAHAHISERLALPFYNTGTRAKKFIVDGSFIVSMCSDFLEEYPVFDAERFDPTVSVQSDEDRSIMWLRAVAIILLGLEIGARAGEITRMTVCCWQAREDGSVYVLVHLAKNGKNGELSGAVLVRGSGGFKDNYSAISFFEEFYFPFLRVQGLGLSNGCIASKYRTVPSVAAVEGKGSR